MENPDSIFACETGKMRIKQITYNISKKNISSESFRILNNNKNSNADAARAKKMHIHPDR